jgi:serine protease Do
MMRGYEQIAERLRQSAVQIGGGSGVIWHDGTIVTNAHVVRQGEAAIVYSTGQRSTARVVLCDRDRDIALLRPASPPCGLPAAIGDSDCLRPGQFVLALGNPLGLTGAISAGVVHAASRSWVQADVRLAPGNSGGMLADAAGRVIGINTMIFNGLALAVPSNEVDAFVRAA